jgi:hypothetical protein
MNHKPLTNAQWALVRRFVLADPRLGGLTCSPGRPRSLRESELALRLPPSLEHRRVEFPAYAHGSGLAALPELCNAIGGLCPIDPCGRSSL